MSINACRKDLYKIDIQDNLYLLVFHKMHNGNYGPSVSLYINNYKFLKFDCFGKNVGHYHIYNKYAEYINFIENTVEEQIYKTSLLLLNNIELYIKNSLRSEINNCVIDMKIFNDKIAVMVRKMLEYEQTYYSNSR